ncbi:MAG: hypothetical protein ABI772_07680 [Bacteroidota bacterium]
MNNKKIILIIIILLFNSVNSNCQNNPRWRLNLSIAAMKGKLKNENLDMDETLFKEQKITTPFQIGVSYRTGKATRLLSGLRFTSYKVNYTSHGVYYGVGKIDAGNNYYVPCYFTKYSIDRKLNIVSVPLIMEFETVKTPLHLLFQIGLMNSFVTENVYESSGNYEVKGLYNDPQYVNIKYLVNDIPSMGFSYSAAPKNKVNLKESFFSFYTSVGHSVDLSKRIHLKTSFFYETCLGDIVPSQYRNRDYKNIKGDQSSYRKTVVGGFGIEAGLSVDIGKLKSN